MATADTLTKVQFEKVAAAIGARVSGVALDQQATAKVVETLREGLHEHGVLFFEFGERLESDQFKQFAQLFGEVEPVYGFSTKQEDDRPAPCIDAQYQPLRQYRTNMWHSDGTPMERPPPHVYLDVTRRNPSGGLFLRAAADDSEMRLMASSRASQRAATLDMARIATSRCSGRTE